MSPLTPSMLNAMARHLSIYSIIMLINTVILWNINFEPNSLLLGMVIFGTIGIVPSIFCSYLILYFYFNYLDIFNSNSIHLIFQQKTGNYIKMTPYAQDEDVSDIENYQEDYPEKVIEMNSIEESNSTHSNGVMKIKPQEKIAGDWFNTHVSLS